MLAQRIERARKTSGLSLRDLAAKIGVSQTAINKFEKGVLTPDSTMLIKLAKALNVKVGYFLRSTTLELEKPEYRKKSTLSAKKLQIIEGKILDLIERRMELELLFPKPPVQEFVIPDNLPEKIASLDEIEEVAKLVRKKWQLGLNPIPELVDVLESNGIRVFEIGESAESKFDGLAAKVNGQRVIVISSKWSGDRQRFTMAHELGHLILEGRLTDDIDEERASDRFAGAFLLPQDSIVSELGEYRNRLELQELLMLKQEYGISMSGILYRAKDLGIIKQGYHKQLIIGFSKRGWRKQEPKPYPAETPHHFKQLVFHALAEEYIGESKAAELMDMSVHDFYHLRMIEDGHAASDQ
jgi:Zn-dependent peptidase ImmA (M78 family)